MASNPPFSAALQKRLLANHESQYNREFLALNEKRQAQVETNYSEAPNKYSTTESKSEAALRYDAGKSRYDLIPPEALDAIATLYTYGANKYAERNWEKGMSWSRCFGSLMRHAWAFWRGENVDPESGLHHMTHAAWNCIALFTYSVKAIGTDDRSKL